LNSSTFYGTNIAPRNPDFNGGLWTYLENTVRSWASSSDTCYVVSGCITKDAKYNVRDRSGSTITVPTAFFKAVLRYGRTMDVGTEGYCAIAFLFDHEEYSQAGKSFQPVNKKMSMSVQALEDVLGYRLFPNLDNVIGKERAAAVKTEDPRENSWWWE
jgi:DNA/RNA endonuclease G (NUC1)